MINYFQKVFFSSVIFIFSLGISLNIKGEISDYIYPYYEVPSISNYGTTGLLQVPTARMHEEGTLAFGWSHNEPYLRGSIIAYPFSWFEASYQYTDVNNALYSPVKAFSGSQSYKDKSFDAKFKLYNESQYIPAIAIGLRDMAGTGMFASEYLVFSKRVNYIDLTLGLGWGAMGKQSFSNPLRKFSDRFNDRGVLDDTLGGEFTVDSWFSGPVGIFAGAEISIPNSNGLRFILEYDSTDYDREGFQEESDPMFLYTPKDQQSAINAGFVYPFSENFHIKLGYTKGNTINFGFSYKRSLGKKKYTVKKNQPIIKNYDPNIVKRVNKKNEKYIYQSALKFLAENNIYLQDADISNDTVSITYSQPDFTSGIQAHGRTANIINDLSPENITKFKLTALNGGMAMNTLLVDRDSFNRNKKDKLFTVARRDFDLQQAKYSRDDYEFNPSAVFPTHYWSISPSIRQQIGGPDGFYFGDIRLELSSDFLLSNSMNIMTKASVGITDNFDELKLASDSILPHVRTDIVRYLKESKKYNITQMHFNYFANPYANLYAKFVAGIIEPMFGGYGGEVMYRPFNKNYAISLEAWDVKQRDYEMLFNFLDYRIVTGHLNFFYTEPTSNVTLAIKAGRFLAGDSGVNIDFHRRFESGFRIGAFFAKTDISRLEFGEGSFDKGFYFQMPIDIFLTKHSKALLSWGLRPLTRDGASYLIHSHTLFGVTDQGQGINLHRDWDDFYE